jgi:hypothetical protein
MPCVPGNETYYDFCDFLETINTKSTPYLVHISFAPSLIIIILTLIDRYHEDAKWFTFNTSIINIIMSIAWELKRNPRMLGSFASKNNLIWSIGKDLSQYSIFPLAFTRVFVLYYPDFYLKIFNKKTLFVFIIACDAILGYLSYLCNGGDISWNFILYTGLEVFMLIATFGCSTLVLLKIRKMIKLVGHNSNFTTFDDLRRAAFVCIFQACFYAIYTLLLCYMRLYVFGIIVQAKSDFLIALLSILTELQNLLFLLFVILDALIPMILLRSYRNTIRKVCLVCYHIVRYTGRKPMSIMKVTLQPSKRLNSITPRINNLMPNSK